MSKYTDWYPAEVKPVYAGFYQRKYSGEEFYTYGPAQVPDYWDGGGWYLAWNGEVISRASDSLQWRGLKSPAK